MRFLRLSSKGWCSPLPYLTDSVTFYNSRHLSRFAAAFFTLRLYTMYGNDAQPASQPSVFLVRAIVITLSMFSDAILMLYRFMLKRETLSCAHLGFILTYTNISQVCL